MPYITRIERETLEAGERPISSGQLNYCITMMCHDFLGLKPGYAEYNRVLGVLEAVKLELYRRHVSPYEDLRLQQNGDVP